MYGCAASFCENTRYKVKQHKANITFHTFPTDQGLCRKWIQFCKQHKSWTPSKQSLICSVHFKPDDYQLSQLPLHQKRIELRRLQSGAVPSITSYNPTVKIELNDSDESQQQEQLSNAKPDATDPMVLKFRDQVCRTCLNHCADESLISVDSEIQRMTVLDMLIQLTAFEAENNDAFPMVICLECKDKLELAYNIRQEFIAQTEHLVQLVAEEKILSYFKKISDIDQKYESHSNDGMFTNDIGTSDSGQETVDTAHDEKTTINLVETNQLEISNLNDHACYTKVPNQFEDHHSSIVKKKLGIEKCVQLSPTAGAKPEDLECSAHFRRGYEEEKTSTRTRKAEIQRTRYRKKLTKALISKRESLATAARKKFPFTTCYICDTKHNTLMERDYHMRKHVPMLPYQCNECNSADKPGNKDDATKETLAPADLVVLKTTNQLNSHFRMHRMPHKCDKCNHRFSTTTKLKYHFLAVHAYEENMLTCEYCGKQYCHKIAFRKHIAHHRNEQSGQFKCTICDRSFGVKSSLQRHLASHNGERKYKCMYCDKAFSTSYNRLTHQRTHTGERPHECADCGQTFSQSTTLKTHREARHNVGSADKGKVSKSKPRSSALLSKNDVCPFAGCNYKASTYAAMYAHKRSKHKPMHPCEVCGKSFAFANQLKTHMMLHTGEKPYKCEECDRSFRLIKDYRWHIETHKSDSTHVCKICRKCFKLQRYLQAHLLTHTIERRFACHICRNRYKTNGELKKHNQQKHAGASCSEHSSTKGGYQCEEEHPSSSLEGEDKYIIGD